MTEREQPLVTFALLAYNQERFISDAINGALAQDYSPLEIIISDDCSTDRTFELIEEIGRSYSGKHKLRINRNPVNLGLTGHVNHITEFARGEIIVAAAGDDVSLPERVSCIVDAFIQHRPMLIHSAVIMIDANGVEIGPLKPSSAMQQPIIEEIASMLSLYIGASGAWASNLNKIFRPIEYPNSYEDLIFAFRAALVGSISYIDKPLVKYRVGTGISTRNYNAQLFKEVFANRRRLIRTGIDVFLQRECDLDCAEPTDKSSAIRHILRRSLMEQKIRLAFYEDVSFLVKHLLSNNCLPTLKVVAQEFLIAVHLTYNYLRNAPNKGK